MLRPPRGVHEAHLHLSYKPFVIREIQSQTYGNVMEWSSLVVTLGRCTSFAPFRLCDLTHGHEENAVRGLVCDGIATKTEDLQAW